MKKKHNDCAPTDESKACRGQTGCVQDHVYCKQGYCVSNRWVCEQPYSCLDREFCYNGGACFIDKIVEHNQTYSRPRCECKDSRYRGPRCEQCEQLACENGGWCTYPTNYTTPECRCAPGYLGADCQKSLCMNYCSNGGLCRLVGGIPKCECKDPRYRGPRCDVNRCNCQNGGYCSSSNGICICPENFMGRHCERFIASSCKKVDCNNNGVCKLNEHDQFAYCDCSKEFKGVFCDIPVTNGTLDCANSYHCLNGGECAVVDGALICK